MPDHVLRPFRPDDAPVVHELHARHATADAVDVHSTMEPLLDPDGVRRGMEAADWAVVAVDASESVVGWGSLRSWTEDDGTHVCLSDGYVAPSARRHGLGGRLLQEAEGIAARLSAGRAGNGPVVLGGNASTVQPDRMALLERRGYRQVFTMVEMEHHGSPVQPRQLPDGITVRAAAVADARPLLDLTARVWAERPFFTLPAEDGLRDWLSRSQLDLFQVATLADRVVGFVAASRTPACVEIEDVQVDPDLQRRGLATAMLTRTLSTLTQQGAGPIRLHTEGHDPSGARSLYERLGFQVVREYRRYRKPLGR
ncbi:GNAT family N-acetyltransferase [Catellatospora vulcania]|uniref:GNAT family N-acetyltransferase n=1 Tax=Catellatospora vulcania TaxID=1460450 RepID=UPI0012D465EC|nr:GNAT family N-acetyltransferase [Catellatospora vulcania]